MAVTQSAAASRQERRFGMGILRRLAGDDDCRKAGGREHFVEDAKERRQEIVDAELEARERLLPAERIDDVPGDDAELVEEKLRLHLPARLAHFSLQLALGVTAEVAELPVEIAVQARVVRHEH